MLASYKKSLAAAFVVVFHLALVLSAHAQSGNSTSIAGTVLDPSGAVVINATVEARNPVSGFSRSTVTDAAGKFAIPNVPFNPYHLTVTAKGFAPHVEDVNVRSAVPINLSINLEVTGSSEVVTVEATAEDLLENTSTFHTDVDKEIIDRLPLESASSSVSSLVTLATPGIAADSNGLFHGMGDHAENSFSVDGQPITDQQSKVFSNQIPLDSIASMEVISGAPPAEFGEKTSVVINVTTRSGQGVTTPHGAVTASYGNFGTSGAGFNLAYGGQNWGNFISVNGLNSGRFLDPPEFTVIHDKGNEENLFDRVDYQVSKADSIHVNLGFTRSWFQNPNSFDNVLHTGETDPSGNPLGPTDQRSQIRTFNIAPSWTRLLNNNAVFTMGGFVRRDQYNYYPSPNLFNDLSPIQKETVGQDRTLTNAGLRSDLSYVKGIHNIKVGATYQQTFLNENDRLGIVDNGLLPSLTDANGNPCFVNNVAVDSPCTDLLPYRPDPWRRFVRLPRTHGRQTARALHPGPDHQRKLVIQCSVCVETSITGWPRTKKPSLVSGSRTTSRRATRCCAFPTRGVLETPFNENLIVSSTGCSSPVLSPLLGCAASGATPLSPGWRNEFHAGIQQAFGRYLVFSGEYIWKYTHNGYDFSMLGNTPIFFPVSWDRSKIPGFAGRVSVPNFHGFSALMVFSSVAARFFLPQISGAGATPSAPGGVFRIDHDEKFNQTTHLQYQPWQRGPWFGFNWRYDSGLVAGAVPFAADATTPVDLTGLTGDQQMQAGLFCGNVFPTLTSPLTSCAPPSTGQHELRYRRRERRMTTTIRRASLPGIFLTSPWDMTTCFTVTSTSGVFSSPPST